MNTLIKEICKNEGIITVKAFRSFFEYYIIGWGELDDDFSPATKRIAKNKTVAQWKKWYKEVTDEEISENLATKEEETAANIEFKARIEESKKAEAEKTEEEKRAEEETEQQMRDAGLEYDPSKTWEENIKENALNPGKKIDEVKKYTGYGYHGGGRKATGIKRVSICISGQPEQIEELKQQAAAKNMTVSAYIFQLANINKNEK